MAVTLTTTRVGHQETIYECDDDDGICSINDYMVGFSGFALVNATAQAILVGATPSHGNDNFYNHWMTTNALSGLSNAVSDFLNANPGQGQVAQNLMTEWHARYGGRGVMVYWHVEKKSACIYSQLKTCSSSEVASMIEGVLRHCTEMEVDRNYVDTHGQSEVAFAFCRLLGFQLLPRLKAIHSQKLHPAEAGGKTRYPNLAPVIASPIDWDLIEAEYDPSVRYATGLRLGTANAEDILRRFTRNNAQHPTYRALTELGQACKTIFLCRYLRQAALRREIHEGLQVIENWNSANGFIYFARGGEFASNRVDDQEIAMLSLRLLQICLVYINTLMIQRILAEPEWRDRLTAVDRRGLTPLVLTHINPYGIFELDMNTRLPLDPPRHGPGSARGQMWLYDEQVG